jgi:hypothetical protein
MVGLVGSCLFQAQKANVVWSECAGTENLTEKQIFLPVEVARRHHLIIYIWSAAVVCPAAANLIHAVMTVPMGQGVPGIRQ